MGNEKQRLIQVTHLNVRLSISIMLLKLLFVEVVAGIVVIFFHTGLMLFDGQRLEDVAIQLFQVPLYIALVGMKSFVSFFIILQWLNEYYEITPTAIFHRRGVIFRREDRYILSHIAQVEVIQTFFGRLLNYGTITLYDARRNKYEDMYMIHNAIRYAHVIESLLPTADEKKRYLRGGIEEEIFNGSPPQKQRVSLYKNKV